MIDEDFVMEDYDQAREEIGQLLRGLPLHVAESARELLVACLALAIAEEAAPLWGAGRVLGPETAAFIAEARVLPVLISRRHLHGVGVVSLDYEDGAPTGGTITSLGGVFKLSPGLAAIFYEVDEMLGVSRRNLAPFLETLAMTTGAVLGGDDD